MAVKVKIDLREIEQTIKLIPSSIKTRSVADFVKEKMLDLISKGISPIEGQGRFPGYKNPKEGYPATVKTSFGSKRPRPVNLTLSGKFLRRLIARPKGKFTVEIGFFDKYGKDLEQGHREGTNGQLKRPIIPQTGERFVNSIRLGMIKMIREAVQEFINARR